MQKCGLLILFIHHFSKKFEKNYIFYLFFIDNEKRIQHFKFVPLDYGCSGVYLQKCKVTGNPTFLIAGDPPTNMLSMEHFFQ